MSIQPQAIIPDAFPWFDYSGRTGQSERIGQ